MEIECPKCGLECEGEVPNHIGFYHCECECGLEFCYDEFRGEYFTIGGDTLIKGGA